MEESPLYLKYLCKLIKRTIEKNSDNNFTHLFDTLNEVEVDFKEEAKTLFDYIFKAIENNIEWNPEQLDEYIKEKEIHKKGNDTAIELFQNFNILEKKLNKIINEKWKSF